MALLLELDALKAVYRKSYVIEGRRENAAEHSWYLAVALLGVRERLPVGFDLGRAIELALLHDVSEIGADDVCAYHADEAQAEREAAYLAALQSRHLAFGERAMSCWLEYERQETLESRWVKVLDKLLPFLLNLATEGRTWREQGITAPMVRAHNRFIAETDPELCAWLEDELERAVQRGWLLAA